MERFTRNSTKWNTHRLAATTLLALLGALVSCKSSQGPAATATTDNSEQTTFATPAEAGHALQAASRAKDENALAKILGSNSKAVLSSGDPVEDAAALDSFVIKYDRMNRWVAMTDGSQFLYIGADNYAFPIPLAKQASKWYFNTKAGEDEVLTRRIGRNELLAIDACKAMASAEELYFKKAHDGSPAHLYTPIIISSAGKQDGLYWDVPDGQEASPLGRLKEFAKGSVSLAASTEPQIFDGYYFRILTAQGDKVTGGAKSYIADGKMTGGFAIIASPVKYQSSGIMTFILSQEGVVYQKDLGEKTAETATSIKEYDPTSKWEPAE
jgi:Protein of unknown function (DUF2950)